MAIISCARLSSAREQGLAANTLMLVAGTCAIALPIGTLLAVLVGRCDVAGRKGLVLGLAIWLFLPLYVQNAAWQAGFGQQGWWQLLFSCLGTPPFLYGWRGAMWIHAAAAVPWVVLIVGAGLRSTEPELEEAALVEGSPLAVLLHVTLRRSLTAILAAALWIAVVVSGEITVTDMWQLRTYAEEVYIGFALGDTIEEVTLHILPGLLLIASLALAAIFALLQLAPRDMRPAPRPPWTFRPGPWRWPLTLLAWAIVLLLAGLPLGNLLVQLGLTVQHFEGTVVRTWSLFEAASVLARSPGEFRREFVWSLVTGGLAASVAVSCAIPLAWGARARGVTQTVVLLAAAILLAIPGPILGLILIALRNSTEWPWLHFLYNRSVAAPTLALVLRALPLALLVMLHALASVPAATLELAEMEGAGCWRRLWRIALPQRMWAVAAAWLVALAVAVGDLSASFLVLPPGVSPLSRRIFEEAHYGVGDRLAGLTLTAIGLVAMIAVSALALWQRQIAVAADPPHEL